MQPKKPRFNPLVIAIVLAAVLMVWSVLGGSGGLSQPLSLRLKRLYIRQQLCQQRGGLLALLACVEHIDVIQRSFQPLQFGIHRRDFLVPLRRQVPALCLHGRCAALQLRPPL